MKSFLKNRCIRLIATTLLISSCASHKYTDSERSENNSFTILCNVQGASVRIESDRLNRKESFAYTNTSVGNGRYKSVNTYNKLKFRRTHLIIEKENYEPEKVKVWRLPRGKAFGKDFLLGSFTYFTPFFIDVFRSDFYKVAGWSKEIEVNLKYTQDFMKQKYLEIEKSTVPEPFISYTKEYWYSNYYKQALDKIDSTELLVAVEKSSEAAIDQYISSHQKSRFNPRAIEIKNKIVEARKMFDKTKAVNTVKGYEDYLTKYPFSLQRKDAINRLVDVAFKNSIKENKVDALTTFNSNYLKKYESSLEKDTVISKTKLLTKIIDLQIIKENDLDNNKYIAFSKVWTNYKKIKANHSNLGEFENCENYKIKIANLLILEVSKLVDEAKQKDFLTKVNVDFPKYNIAIDTIPLIAEIINNATNFSGSLKLFKQDYIDYQLSFVSENDNLKNIVGFNYKGQEYSNYKEKNIEELTFKNGMLNGIKLFNGKIPLFSGVENGTKFENNYYLNGKLVKTDFRDGDNYYSYEFENGVNLSFLQLEETIKNADYELSVKNYDRALEIYNNECKNNYPSSIPLNVRIKKSIQNAENQKAVYLANQEKQRIAEEKRQEQIRIAEERRMEKNRIAEERKQKLQIEAERKNEVKYSKNRNIEITNSISKINVYDENAVEKFMLKGHSWSCPDAGTYTLYFTYDYYSGYNTYALIFWTLDKNDPVGVFVNVDFDPGSWCTISGMDPQTGNNIRIDLYQDGHCESGGKYFKRLD